MKNKQIARKVLTSLAIASLMTSLVPSNLVQPVHALADHEHQLVEIQRDKLIQNADFESGNANWNIVGQNSGIVTTDKGKSATLPKTTDSHANGHIWQEVTLKPNTEYTLKANVKFTSTEKSDSITLDVKTGGLNNPKTFKESKITPKDEWQEVSLTFTTSSETKYIVGVARWVDGQAPESLKNSTVFVDDVKLTGPKTVQETYDILWADDFNQETLNTKDWGYELGSIRGVEQQHYVKSDKNVFMRNGNLVLKATDRAKEDHYKNPRGNRTVIYDSGSVRTHGKKEFLYGRIEMRAKLPKGRGAFPAFWTLGSDFTLDGKVNGKQGYGWSRCGEIDIMELLGGHEGEVRNKQVWGTPHFYDKNKGDQWDQDYKGSGGQAYTNPTGKNFNDDYHVFGINWNPDKIEWYVDGVIYNTLDLTNPEWGASAKKCFNRPQYIQLNLAMGGNWPGDVATNLAGTEFAIDYVYYAQNDAQKAAAKAYYDEAPELTGVKDLQMVEGTTPDLLANVASNRNSFVDFSIENEHMFKNEGGLTSVDLLVTGKDDLNSLAKLPVGTYNIHYTAIPNDIEYDGNRPNRDTDYKFTRKTATLTVKERTFPTNFPLNGVIGQKLNSIKLPDGWSWVNPDTVINSTSNKYEVKYTSGDFSKIVNVVVNAVTANKVSLQEKFDKANELANTTDTYTEASMLQLKSAMDETYAILNNPEATEQQVIYALNKLNNAIANLQAYVSEKDVNDKIDEASSYLGKDNEYTKESVDNLNKALKAVKDAVASGDKEAIQAAYTQLNKALSQMVKIENSNTENNNTENNNTENNNTETNQSTTKPVPTSDNNPTLILGLSTIVATLGLVFLKKTQKD